MLRNFKKIIKYILSVYYTRKVKNNAIQLGTSAKINFKTVVNNRTIIGDNFNSNGLIIIGKGDVIIGDNFHCGLGCYIITENHNHLGTKLPYDSSYIVKKTSVGDNVWFGINVTLLPGVSVGEGAIIQAGSVVVSDIPALAIAGGHPAKVFSSRNDAHYFDLKDKKQFH